MSGKQPLLSTLHKQQKKLGTLILIMEVLLPFALYNCLKGDQTGLSILIESLISLGFILLVLLG